VKSKRIASPLAAVGLVLTLLGLAGLAREVPAIVPAPPASVERRPIGPIDVNVASIVELQTLPRIGPALAARIVADRIAHGPFSSLDALDRVPGVGPSTIAGLRPHAIAGQ
jgi:competence protein ComEA